MKTLSLLFYFFSFSTYAFDLDVVSYQKLKQKSLSLSSAKQSFEQVAAFSLSRAFLDESKTEYARHIFQNSFDPEKTEVAFSFLEESHRLIRIPEKNIKKYLEYCEKKKTESCIFWLKKIQSVFRKNSPEVESVYERISKLTQMEETSTIIFLSENYPQKDEDLVFLAEALEKLSEKNYSSFSSKLEEFLEKFPKSSERQRALYWLGELEYRKENLVDAKKYWNEILRNSPFGYYAILVAKKLNHSLLENISGVLPEKKTTDSRLSPRELFSLRRTEKFLKQKRSDLAAKEVQEISLDSKMSSEFLYYFSDLANQTGNYPKSFQAISALLKRDEPRHLNSHILRLIFPVNDFEEIKTFAEKESLDPLLVMSLIKQESAFQKEAVSRSYAQGMMQLMNFTALDMDPKVTLSELFEPKTNLRIGTKYLKKMMEQFSDNAALALGAYNAGPGRMSQWQKSFGDRNLEEFIELIPYQETRNYVLSIFRNYYWYSYLIKKEFPKNYEVLFKR